MNNPLKLVEKFRVCLSTNLCLMELNASTIINHAAKDTHTKEKILLNAISATSDIKNLMPNAFK
jgi:hypothetical protein